MDVERRPGTLLWLTGLSGAGKTSVALKLRDLFFSNGRPVILLDGDVLRGIIGTRFGYDPEDRRYLAMCYSRLCKELTDQGFDVICATISMFEAVRRWNRSEIPEYCEVYLRVPPHERRRRDSKSVYADDKAVEFPKEDFEEPGSPDLLIDNHGDMSAAAAAEVIWRAYVERLQTDRRR